MEDSNCSEVKWETFEGVGANTLGNTLLKLTMNNTMIQWVIDNTIYREDKPWRLLDLLYAQEINLKKYINHEWRRGPRI